MSIFGSIMSKIFHHAEAAPAPQQTADAGASAAPAPIPAAPTSGSAPAPSAPTGTASAPAGAPVDVAAVLTGLAAKNSQTLDWKHSIVDMMKLLDLDSSLTARKALATELNYTGDQGDSATMNVWLHSQVMQKLAANGGKVPDELKN